MIRIIPFLILFTLSFVTTNYAAEKDTLILRISRMKSPKEQAKAFDKACENSWKTGSFSKGITYGKKGLKIAQEHHLNKIEASLLNNIGITYDYLGNYPLSLNNYFEALKIQERIKDSTGIAYTLSNIGLIYSNQGDNDIALKYHYRSLFIRKSIHYKPGEAASLNNIGICHLNKKNYTKAEYYFNRSKAMDVELNDSMGLMDDLNNLAICYMKTGQTDIALKTFTQCAELRAHFNDQFGLSKAYSNIGTCYSLEHKWKEAEKYFFMALKISKEINGTENIWYSYANLSDVYAGKKDYPRAYKYAKLAEKVKEKLSSESSVREETETEMKYLYDKRNEQIRIQQVKKDVINHERGVQFQVIIWSMIAIVIVIGIFSIFLYRRWKLANDQRRIIELQRAEVQTKNTEIVDSINYAQRIQSAILPSGESLKEIFERHALVYQPKDIVAGDFYWIHNIDDTTYFAVADCTGHGVPGAFMSLLCNNALNRAILEYDAREPGDILTKTRSIIVTEFAKSHLNLRDGMDISLFAWNRKTNACTWAGANNPLWVLYPDQEEMLEIKGDKQPVGNHHNFTDFTTHQVELKPGARLYLFTDGIADQFGEITGKKFKSKRLKEMLISSRHQDIDEQARLVKDSINDWKGKLEQIDDICLMIIQIGADA